MATSWFFMVTLLTVGMLCNVEANGRPLTLRQGINLIKYVRDSLRREPTRDHKPHLNYEDQVTSLATSITKHFFNDVPYVVTVKTEDGFRYEVASARQKVDFLILLDSSASIGMENFRKATDIVTNWVDILDDVDFANDSLRVGLLTFSEPDKLYYGIPFEAHQNKEEIKHAIQNSTFHNGTSTSTEVALWMANHIFTRQSRESATKVLLLVTDGWSKNPLGLPFGVLLPAAKLRQQNVLLFVVGIGDKINHNELTALANKPSENFLFEVEDYSMMEAVMAAVRDNLR